INLSVTTSAADNIGQTSATLNGSISNPDNIAISAQGFEWKAATEGTYTQVPVSGTTLSHNLTGLTPYTTYTFHAFATTSDGTVYGDEMSFTTEALEFTVTTAPATDVSYTSATLHGSIANPAHANVTVTAQGFEWKKTTGGTYTQVPVSGTTLSYNLTGLTTGTGYTFRTFADLASGSTVYGSEQEFTTLSYRRILLDTIAHDFVAQYGDTLVNTLTSPHKISIAAGATITLRGATINGEDDENYAWAGISCEEGDATINLEGANTVKGFAAYPGIYIAQGYTLTIQGAGSLNAGSYGNGAGIGGGYLIPCGNIVIGGGVINATGALYAAGLGSGAGASCGGITINGGTLTANGGNWAPGIGVGLGYGLNSECGNINISSGTVIAQGGQYAAGIGAGVAYTKSSVCGNISISGGTVTATGGERGAGIGAGVGNSSNSTCGNIGISGGEVTATGGSQSNNTNGGTGIGTGYSFENGVGVSSCGDITIESGVIRVTATKGWYAYTIGKDRFNANSLSTCGTVTIGGTVYYDGSDFQNGGNDPTTGLSHSPYVYEP
nr:fibronectin type III domain-containing protein [Bacteroidales bacterium]